MGGGRWSGAVRSLQGGASAACRSDGAVYGPRRLPAGDVHRAGEQGGDQHAQTYGGDTQGQVRSVKVGGVY